MDRAKILFGFLEAIFLSIGGMTMIEAVGAGMWDLSFLKGIDETLKTITALAAFVYLAVSLPYKVLMMKVDRKGKQIDNEIKESEKRILREELKKIELQNKILQRDVSKRGAHTGGDKEVL